MYEHITAALLSFIEGIVLILSPCIWPILPIMLSGSLSGNKSRPLGIIVGFALSFALVTLFSRYIISFLHINPNTLRMSSFIILFLLGLIMISSYLSERFSLLTQGLTQIGQNLKSVNNSQSGFIGGILFGGLVGIIWTPCAGPIIAAVIVQASIQETHFLSFLNILLFALGAGLPMLIIAFAGRSAITHFRYLNSHPILVRKILGMLIIGSVIFFIYQSRIDISSIDGSQPASPTTFSTSLQNALPIPYQAPQIAGIKNWINSAPITLSDLKGKVVLIDFWTYSCINCIRTLPYIKSWYENYHDKGLVIIGIHSPEFLFEHDLNNVINAVNQLGIRYPVGLDNQFITWRNFNNQYWPAHYLINKDGFVVYQHFGEGMYDVTENNIRFLLGKKALNPQISKTAEPIAYETPEIYLGYARIAGFNSNEAIQRNQVADYSYPELLQKDQWALQGRWIIYSDKIVSAEPGASIQLHFQAKNVYSVIGSQKNARIKVIENGKERNTLVINQHQLYSVMQQENNKPGVLELIALNQGLELYTFTFGN